MKLLNLNLGIKLDNSKDVIKLIKEEQCDIVAFQEVMRKKDDLVYDRYDSSNVIKSNTNFKYSFFITSQTGGSEAIHLYKNGIRIIPEFITVTTKFSKNELGCWNDTIY